MRKGGILHPTLNRILTETGHTDLLTLCDRGFPVPTEIERVDLALADDMPTVYDTLRLIDKDFVIDMVIVAEEMSQASPNAYNRLTKDFAHLTFKVVPHQTLKDISLEARATIRTGDTTPYSNLILVSG
jgi:D-ribose pyranase